LRDQIIADKGGRERLSALEIEQIENAVMTATILRSLQVRWAKREPISADERALAGAIATITNTFSRLAESIGSGRVPKDVTPTIDAVIAELAKEDGDEA
jgi:hypothetical protein